MENFVKCFLDGVFALTLTEPPLQVCDLHGIIIHGLGNLKCPTVDLLLLHLGSDVDEVLVDGVDEQLVVGALDAGEEVVFAESVVGVHVVNVERNLLQRYHVRLEVLDMRGGGYPTV